MDTHYVADLSFRPVVCERARQRSMRGGAKCDRVPPGWPGRSTRLAQDSPKAGAPTASAFTPRRGGAHVDRRAADPRRGLQRGLYSTLAASPSRVEWTRGQARPDPGDERETQLRRGRSFIRRVVERSSDPRMSWRTGASRGTARHPHGGRRRHKGRQHPSGGRLRAPTSCGQCNLRAKRTTRR